MTLIKFLEIGVSSTSLSHLHLITMTDMHALKAVLMMIDKYQLSACQVEEQSKIFYRSIKILIVFLCIYFFIYSLLQKETPCKMTMTMQFENFSASKGLFDYLIIIRSLICCFIC